MFLFIQLQCTCEGWHFAHTWKRSLRGLGYKTILDLACFFKVPLTHAVQEGDRSSNMRYMGYRSCLCFNDYLIGFRTFLRMCFYFIYLFACLFVCLFVWFFFFCFLLFLFFVVVFLCFFCLLFFCLLFFCVCVVLLLF